MSGVTMFHASEQVVEQPVWNHAKDSIAKVKKDFGQGFYMCEATDYPIRLYCDRYLDNKSVYINEYILDKTDLNTLTLKDGIYWAMVAAAHRSDFTKHPEWHLFRDTVRSSLLTYELVVGTISNDRLFSTMNDFIRNRCTDTFLLDCLRYMQYPMQYVSKCAKTDTRLMFVRYIEVSQDKLREVYERQEEECIAMENVIDEMQNSHRKLVREKRKAGDYTFEGRFFVDIIDDWVAAGQPKGIELKNFLPELSERGSRDDVSIAGIFRNKEIK